MNSIRKIMLGVATLAISSTVFGQSVEAPVKIEVGGEIIDNGFYSAPLVEDFDNDGLDDLIIGSLSGDFKVYKNIGTKRKPKYQGSEYIMADGQKAKIQNW